MRTGPDQTASPCDGTVPLGLTHSGRGLAHFTYPGYNLLSQKVNTKTCASITAQRYHSGHTSILAQMALGKGLGPTVSCWAQSYSPNSQAGQAGSYSYQMLSSTKTQVTEWRCFYGNNQLTTYLHVVFEDLGVWLLKHLTHFL